MQGLWTGRSQTAPNNEKAGAHRLPLFPTASDPNGRQGFVRVINRSDTAGSVTIRAFDDTDRVYDALMLAVRANERRHFNSNDLELGNDGKGLSGRTGAGEGDWRLVLSSDLEIDVLAYVRTTDGFLTAMHDTVLPEGTRHRVAFFNPGSNLNQASRLRLINTGEDVAEVTVLGIDDAGKTSDTVSLSVPPDSSRSLTAQELESGGDRFHGMLGDGVGKWRLDVTSTQPITVMSLLSSRTGHLTNLSTAPASNSAPVDHAMFRERFRGGWIVAREPESRVEFHADGRFTMADGSGSREGDYTYTRTARNEASVVLDFDDSNGCTYELDFDSRLAGSHSYTCDDGTSGESAWHAEPPGMVAEVPPPFELDAENRAAAGIAHADGLLYVPDAVDGKVYVYTTEGKRRADADFTLDGDNDDPTGIAHADGRLYVVDDEDAKVYAYRISGVRDAGSDFELDEDNELPEGMTYADGRFHCVDYFGDVFAYRSGGTRDPDADFELDGPNLFPAGITHAERRFFVVDWLDERVYAYSAAGERADAFDFVLDLQASVVAGITHDGRWFYVVDKASNRVWVYSGDERPKEGPDLVVADGDTSDPTVVPGGNFELRLVVLNRGTRPSAATTLRYYLSDDTSIRRDDREVGSREVDVLEGDEYREYAVELTAPSEPGAYHYGGCVDAVDAETDERNNCSGPLGVAVSAVAPTVRRIDLADLDTGEGVAHANGMLYVAVWGEDKVYAYTVSGERDDDLDFDLDADNDNPEQLAHADGRLYVIDQEDGRVYAYDLSGDRAMDSDFDLDPDHVDPDGIAHADGMFYVVDERLFTDVVLAYTASGERAADGDFDLDDYNGGATGITYAGGRLYVVDTFDHKVFAYTTAGEREPALEFDLAEDNRWPEGMAYGDGSFFVHDGFSDQIFVYTVEGGAATAPDSHLE